jgi:hypothetical protein
MEGVSRNFECEYTSLSKDKYRSTIKIEHLNLVTFEEGKVSWWRDLFGRKVGNARKSSPIEPSMQLAPTTNAGAIYSGSGV